MAGIDRITDQIREEAENTGKQIVEEAGMQEETLKRENRETIQKELEKARRTGEKRAGKLLEKSRSAAVREQNFGLLAEKQKLIRQTLDQAMERLENLEEETYFGLILQMVPKWAEERKGLIRFSPRDKKRLPGNFQKELDRVCREEKREVKIHEKTQEIAGGFILVYGGVEVNCSFEALFQAEEGALQDLLKDCLFSAEVRGGEE